MKTSEVLNTAADAIERRGWAGRDVEASLQWGSTDESSPICIEGGIIAALGGLDAVSITDVDACPAYQAVHAYLGLGRTARLYQYNDALERTATEVIEVLRACALIEAAREDQDAAEATYADNLAAVTQ